MPAKFLSSGDSAIVVEFGDQIDRAVSDEVLNLAARIGSARIPGIIETVPTFRSLMIHYEPLRITAAELTLAVEALLTGPGALDRARRLWRVPVCYDDAFAPDLAEIAERTGLSVEQVVQLHSTTRYHVYMIGFLPGFPYMGDLPQQLVLPRRTDPRLRVPPGSVAIAMSMTAIYPIESPGGWHLIGTTPIALFDALSSPPALFEPGDAVSFERIGRDDFAELQAAVERGDYQLPQERLVA
ncbi:MAG: 5-oxoprolinase subunit PxpB [Alphaproteobacteria bacterium]|nr:5-oxoprolinase subunit PxpB [Alphaproteobacteria bacterium]